MGVTPQGYFFQGAADLQESEDKANFFAPLPNHTNSKH